MGIASKEGTVLQLFRRRHRKNKIIEGFKKPTCFRKRCKRWNKQEVRFDDILAVTETKLNDEVKKLLGALEMIQELRTCCTTSQTIPVDYYWEKIRFSKDKDSKEFMGKFELEDISDWAELYVNTERIVKCPYCRKENSIDVKEYIYDETMEEKSCGIEKYSYFEVDDCRCHSCGKEFVSKGYICEYPIGVYDSHEIKTIKNEEAE